MIRVMFVDDDPVVLASLRNLFHRERKVWQMRFAGGGHEALAALAAEPADVIVTDMRMPQMDGAELLQIVSERLPAIGRLVLTGYSEPACLARAQRVAHEVLNKPCDVRVLRDAIVRFAHSSVTTPPSSLPLPSPPSSTPPSVVTGQIQVPMKSP